MNETEFFKEFKALLEKYNVDIHFTCDDSSDTYGIIGAKMCIDLDRKRILEVSNWWLDSGDIPPYERYK